MEALNESEEREGNARPPRGQIVTQLERSSVSHEQTSVTESMRSSLAPRRGRKISVLRTASRVGNPSVTIEPTYRMQPHLPFSASRISRLIQELVDLKVATITSFHSKQCRVQSRVLSDELRIRVKECSFDRYKIVAHVVFVENLGQSQVHSSRCLWDTQTDTVAEYVKQTPQLICIASVFGVYHE